MVHTATESGVWGEFLNFDRPSPQGKTIQSSPVHQSSRKIKGTITTTEYYDNRSTKE